MKFINYAILLRIIFVFSIVFSLAVIYNVYMVNQSYEVFTNPEGPDTSDYFE
jgi:hypothetical protein